MGLRPYLKADNHPMRKVPSLYQEGRNVLSGDVECQLRNSQANRPRSPFLCLPVYFSHDFTLTTPFNAVRKHLGPATFWVFTFL